MVNGILISFNERLVRNNNKIDILEYCSMTNYDALVLYNGFLHPLFYVVTQKQPCHASCRQHQAY
jgi:hypothetical protein